VLARSARGEFEANRGERDAEAVGRLLAAGRDALAQTLARLAAAEAKLADAARQAARSGLLGKPGVGSTMERVAASAPARRAGAAQGVGALQGSTHGAQPRSEVGHARGKLA